MPVCTIQFDKSLAGAIDNNPQMLATMAHLALTDRMKKPGEYVAVSVTMADCVIVGGNMEKGVMVHLDCIKGDFKVFMGSFTGQLESCGISKARVMGTYREIGAEEFAPKGTPVR